MTDLTAGAQIVQVADGGVDLSFEHMPRVSTRAELEALTGGKPKIVYVYSPFCYYCRMRGPQFDKAAKGLKHVVRYNATPADWDTGRQANLEAMRLFKTIVGMDIDHYPAVIGISKQGRVVEYNGSYGRKALQDMFKVLQKT